MVSIITPVYGAEDFIGRCAESLFGQTYADIEYIFVDDCSPDRSVERMQEVLSRYPHRRPQVKVVRHAKNRGVAAARNTGVAAATGDYIYYVDADDWIEPDAIGQMCALAASRDADIVGCGWFLAFSRNERRMPMPSYLTPAEALQGMLCGQLRWNLWLFMVRRTVYVEHDIRFIEGENVGEDMLVLIQLFAYARSIAFVERPLYHYQKLNAQSITQLSEVEKMHRLSHNLNAAVRFLEGQFGADYGREVNFFKLNAKMPLLITDDRESHRLWAETFPEANRYIMQNRMQSLRMRLVQWMAAKGQFWAVRAYYRLVFKFVYGILFK